MPRKNSKKKKRSQKKAAAKVNETKGNETEMGNKMDTLNLQTFLGALMKEAMDSAGADKFNFDEVTGILHCEVKGSKRAMTPVNLFQEYIHQHDKEKDNFIKNAVKTFLSSETSIKPTDFESAKEMLKPRLQTAAYFRKKQAELPPGQVIPFVALSGVDSAELLDARKSHEQDLGLCVVVDLKHALVPVLSGDLQMWGGRPFEDVLKIAVANLKAISGGGSKKAWRFGRHPSGCCQSQWVDNFDSTRAAVFPGMMAGMAPGTMMTGPAPTKGGDPICMFVNQSQCLAAGSLNPLSLCFMGDLTLDVVKKQAEMKMDASQQTAAQLTSVLLSRTAYRLVTQDAPANMSALQEIMKASKGRVYGWERYVRKDKPEREFSIPRTQEEIDAVLEGTKTGKIPIFDEKKNETTGEAIPETPVEQAARLKAEGNALFGKKKWSAALKKYSAALDIDPKNHLLFGNRAMCHLKMTAAAAKKTPKKSKMFAERALEDATSATEIEGKWWRGWQRKGEALKELGRLEEALDALRIGIALKDIGEKEKKTLEKVFNVILLKIKQDKERLMEMKAAAATAVAVAKASRESKYNDDDDLPNLDDDDDDLPILDDDDDDFTKEMSLFSLNK